jgi:hypothetical protein
MAEGVLQELSSPRQVCKIRLSMLTNHSFLHLYSEASCNADIWPPIFFIGATGSYANTSRSGGSLQVSYLIRALKQSRVHVSLKDHVE